MAFEPGDIVLIETPKGLERGKIGSIVRKGEFMVDDILNVSLDYGLPRGKNPRYHRKASDTVLVHRPIPDYSWKKA